jgi:phosphohistidine phosphatase
MVAAEKTKSKPPIGYELYIMRHGIAVERGSPGFADDTRRTLTPEGHKKTTLAVQGLFALGVDLDWIVSSPLVRAVETAKIAAEALGRSVPLDMCDELRPGGSAEALVAFLARHANRPRVLVVGHEPDLSEMAARLVGAGRRAHFSLKKAGCCMITFDDFPPKSPGKLIWWLTPRVLRKLV